VAKIKKEKLVGCMACPLGPAKDQNFIQPEIPIDPELIVLFSAHDKDGKPNSDISDLLRLVETQLRGRKAIFLGSQQCKGAYSLKSLGSCREAYNQPILDQFPGIPVLSLGEKAAHILLGYKAAMTGKQGMGGKCIQLSGHDCYFTYGDMEHRAHISVMLGSILGKSPDVEYQFGMPPVEFWNSEYIVCDIEHTDCNPYLGGKIDCIGISNDKSDVVYIVLPDAWLSMLPMSGGLREGFNSYTGILVGHNFSSDLVWLSCHGFQLNKDVKIWDTMIHRKLRPDAPERGFGLKYLVKQDYQWSGYESLVHGCWHRNEIPALEDLAKYNAYDVLGTKRLFLDQQTDERNAKAFFLGMDYIMPMVELMGNGLFVNQKELENLDKSTIFKIGYIKDEISKIVGRPVAFANEEEEEECLT
jgi:hypothetical protein